MAQQSRRNRFIGIAVAVVVAILVAVGVRFAFTAIGGDSKAEMIEKTVDDLKANTDFPQQVDEVTTLDDVKAEDSALHYYYTISGADTTGLTEDSLKESILPQLCGTEETKDILDEDVEMKYSYEVEETGDTYDIQFTKADC